MSLRLQINLLIAALTAIFVAALFALQIEAARNSVREEVEAGNRVATQLLSNFVLIYADTSQPKLIDFLTHLGHLRATRIVLRDAQGVRVYASPPPVYKAGRDAPAWYAALIAPQPKHQKFDTFDGVLEIDADPGRAILDTWDDALRVLGFGALMFILGNVVVFWLVGRATRPFATIARGLDAVQRGAWQTQLPAFAGAEAGLIARAFNRMTWTIEDNLGARAEAIEANLRLARNRELAQLVQSRIEEERREIARELHDEIGQNVTAIKSLALALARNPDNPAPTRATAQLIVDTAGGLYAAMHDMIPRLRPLALDSLGLADALRERVDEWQRTHAQIRFALQLGTLPASLGDTIALTAYRIVQEAVTNALRHAHARRIDIALFAEHDLLRLEVSDDGAGLGDDWQRPGHYGLRGIAERAGALGGEAAAENRAEGGVRVWARIPLR